MSMAPYGYKVVVFVFVIWLLLSSGEPDSYVFGSILDGGLFEGKLVSPKSGNFYVEKAARYFRPAVSNATAPREASTTAPLEVSTTAPGTVLPEGREGIHSVIYKEVDVDDPYEHLRQGESPRACLITRRVFVLAS